MSGWGIGGSLMALGRTMAKEGMEGMEVGGGT